MMAQVAPVTVWCVYPISGAYTQFQRILFWAVIAVIVAFQFYPWLTRGAIAFAALYSFIASLHAVFLSLKTNSVYDADLFALQIILQASSFGALLCLLFSSRILDGSAKKFFTWWCLLAFTARTMMQILGFRAMLSVMTSVVPVFYNRNGYSENPCNTLTVTTWFRGGQAILYSR
jgi:hypothetical protein